MTIILQTSRFKRPWGAQLSPVAPATRLVASRVGMGHHRIQTGGSRAGWGPEPAACLVLPKQEGEAGPQMARHPPTQLQVLLLSPPFLPGVGVRVGMAITALSQPQFPLGAQE